MCWVWLLSIVIENLLKHIKIKQFGVQIHSDRWQLNADVGVDEVKQYDTWCNKKLVCML